MYQAVKHKKAWKGFFMAAAAVCGLAVFHVTGMAAETASGAGASAVVSGTSVTVQKIEGLKQTGIGSSCAKLEWAARAGVSRYEVLVSYDGKTGWTNPGTTVAATTEQTYTISNLSANNSLYVKVTGYASNTMVAESDVILVSTTEAVTGLTQTAATKNSLTMTWSAVKGAEQYGIYAYDGVSTALIGYTDQLSYTVTGLSVSHTGVYMVAVNKVAGSNMAVSTDTVSAAVTMRTAPAKTEKIAMSSYSSSSGYAGYVWTTVSGAEGYQFQLQTYKGKKLKTSFVTTNSVSVNSFKKGIFTRARVRAYVTAGNKKVYGAWSPFTYNAANKGFKVIRSAGGKKITVKFGTIKGASGYKVYISKSPSSGYKKVKTVSANKKKLVIHKAGRKKISKKKHYYVRVEYLIKAGGRQYTSDIVGSSSV